MGNEKWKWNRNKNELETETILVNNHDNQVKNNRIENVNNKKHAMSKN